MIANILNAVLNDQLTTEGIIRWLTTDKPHDVVLPDLVQTESSRAEFVLFFLDYLKKQCSGIIQNGSPDGESAPHSKKIPSKTPEKVSNAKKLIPSSPSDQLNLTCHTSTPLKKPATHGLSLENRSTSFNSSLHSSPIYHHQNLYGSSSDQPSSSLKMDSSFINVSMDSSMSNSSAMSIPFGPVSPLYSGLIQRPQILLNNSHHMKKNFPNIGEHPRNHQRSNKSTSNTSNTSENEHNSQNEKQNNSGQGKTTMKLGDFVVTLSKKSSRRSKSKNQSETSIDKTSEENIKGNSSEKKKDNRSKRRIKPTKLEVTGEKGNIQSEVFGVISRPETKNPQFLEAQTTDKSEEITTFEAERELLKLKRKKQPKIDPAGEITNVQEQKGTKLTEVPLAVSSVAPKLSLVDNVMILDKLADLYGNLIQQNLVPNVMTELYFIMTLITSQFKGSEQMSLKMLKETMGCKDIDESIGEEVIEQERKYLDTSHNCVYFATTVLNNQRDLLTVLDRATIKLLSDNHYIAAFKPELRSYLGELYDKKVQESNQFKENDMRKIGTNVCFQIDTDNRENFSSNIAFSKFRMQRDLFYESLTIWEDRHQSPNWCFSSALQRKINCLLSLHDDTLNYYHMARLFKSQLLTSCLQHSSEDPIDDETLSVLKSLKSMNLEKFKQLQERLVTPLSSEGTVPLPSFPGIQEFYRDFLINSTNIKFNLILENCFVQEIIDLNSTPFTSSDLETRETNVDETTKQKYLICISSLRILSKFLGFLVSIPFKSKSVSLVGTNTQISLRKQVNPSLNFHETLFNALIDGKLTLTVPWIVEYLAVLDSVAFRLPYYKKLCQVLYYIYRNSQSLTSPKGSLLITFTIGRLFELPNLPKDLYFTWQSSFNDKKIKERISLHLNNSEGFEDSLVPINPKKLDISLDQLDLIDDRAIITCCPFLKEFKILLISGNCNFGSINRHITPVSTQLSHPSSDNKAKTLQLQQEDAFFHGQPDSMKKTVDFVSERVASNSVKHICRELIPMIKIKHFNIFRKLIVEKIKNTQDSEARKERQLVKEFLISDNSPNLISSITKDLRDHCNELIPNICKKKCTEALIPLLSDDTHPAVKEMCVKICMRLSIERIDQWLDFYINDAINSKAIHSEYLSFSPKEEMKEVKERVHNSSVPSPTKIIYLVRDSMWELIEANGKWSILTEENVLRILRELKRTLRERKDLQPFVENSIYVLSVDYAIHLIVYNYKLFTDLVLEEFAQIWRNCEVVEENNKLFGGILSPRNIQWLRPTCDANCWRKFGMLIDRMLREKLLGIDNFSEQCVAIFREDLPADVTKFLPECLNEAIRGFKANDEKAERIRMMLKWISGACGELDGCGFSGDGKDYGLRNSGESLNLSW